MYVNEQQYLQSKEWQQKRLERLRIDDFKCCRCGSPRQIQVHHLSYKSLGHEDVHNDLITLCEKCHLSVEKEARMGNTYKKPLNIGSNYGIKGITSIPVEHGIIYSDLQYTRPQEQCQLKGGRIRLCEVHLAHNDFFDNRKDYDYMVEECGVDGVGGSYEDFQYDPIKKSWRIFIEQDYGWYDDGLSMTIRSTELRQLQNGIIEIYAKNQPEPWEGYRPLTRENAVLLTKVLDLCERYSKQLLSV